jgi:hypothetical protein
MHKSVESTHQGRKLASEICFTFYDSASGLAMGNFISTDANCILLQARPLCEIFN